MISKQTWSVVWSLPGHWITDWCDEFVSEALYSFWILKMDFLICEVSGWDSTIHLGTITTNPITTNFTNLIDVDIEALLRVVWWQEHKRF